MRYLLAILLFVSACGADVMPQIGTALQKARDFYVAGDHVQEKLEQVAELVCKEPEPEIVNACADVKQSLAEADRYNDAARDALILALSAYNTVNDELLDAGAP